MPITYHYEIDTKVIRAKATDLVSTKEILDYVTNIIEDTKIEKGFIEVVDFQTVSDLAVTYSELDPFPYIWGKYMKKGCKAVVIYAPTNLSFGTFRMLQTAVMMRHEVAENLFVVVRSKEELEVKLKELIA